VDKHKNTYVDVSTEQLQYHNVKHNEFPIYSVTGNDNDKKLWPTPHQSDSMAQRHTTSPGKQPEQHPEANKGCILISSPKGTLSACTLTQLPTYRRSRS